MPQYIAYGGVALACSTPELENRLNQLLPIQNFFDWDGWNFLGYDTSKLPTPSLPVAPPIRLGTLYWPNDATRPAWFHAVVNDTKLAEIRALLADPMTPLPLQLTDGRTGKLVTAQMYFLPPRPINQLGLSTDGWLITLTDERFFWPWRIGSIPTTPASWTSLFSTIGGFLGTSITVDSIPTEYGTPSAKWKGYLRPNATVFDAAAAQVSQRVVRQLNGTVATVNWTTAMAAFETQTDALQLVAGGLVYQPDIGRYVPEAVAVAFNDWSSNLALPADAPKLFVNYLGLLGGLSASGYGSASGVAATGWTYADTGYNIQINAPQCSALAETMATAWYGWRLPNGDMSIPGIEPYAPTGWEDRIEWVAQIGPDGEPLIVTRVRIGPWNEFPSGHWDGDRPAGTTTTSTTTTRPPCTGLCNWSYDNGTKTWSRTSTTCSSGCDCYYPDFCPTCSGSQTTTTYCFPTVTGTGAQPGTQPQCNTSTTTTGPPCSGSCTWKSYPVIGWVIQGTNPCLPTCPCAKPAGLGPGDCGSPVVTPCVSPPPPPPPPPCSGSCTWAWGEAPVGWIKVTSTCSTGSYYCDCPQPSFSGSVCNERATTPCMGSPDPTTPPPFSCTGRCYWCWSGSAWTFDHTDCIGCTCSAPSFSGSSPGESVMTTCNPPTTTTTTSTTSTTSTTTTSTTTTPPPCLSTCTWSGDGAGGWVITQILCVGGGGCGCTYPVGPSSGTGDFQNTFCTVGGTTTSSTTTTTTSTTTTAAPGAVSLWGCPGPTTQCCQSQPAGCGAFPIGGPYATCAACLSANPGATNCVGCAP